MTETSTGSSPLLQSLALEPLGDSTFRARSVQDERRPVIFGGQIMAQMIVAASRFESSKVLKSLHVVFARSGSTSRPVQIELSSVHSGRALASVAVTAAQGERVLAQGLLLLDAGEPDVIRHQVPAAPSGGPQDAPPAPAAYPGTEFRIVDGVDLMTSAATGGPELDVWVRFSGVPDDQALHQALMAWYTDGFLIGAAMRPHEGIGQEQAHETLSTGVIAHTLTFHEPVRADQWFLIANRSLHAGAGRTYGEGHVFTEDGTLVASFVQENMIRYFQDGPGVRGKAAGAM
jgi:acyl-CoA thioesterase II